MTELQRPGVAIVTDSTSDLPINLAADHGIHMVPAEVRLGGRQYLDGINISREQIYEVLAKKQYPKTASPGAQEFLNVYETIPTGVPILSVHIGSLLSGFYNMALLAAEKAKGGGREVTVFDSQTLSMALGIMAMSAAQLSGCDNSVEEIVQALQDMVPRLTVMASLDSLDAAVAGGRVSHISGFVGGFLRLKPIIQIKENQVTSPAKPRTKSASLGTLVELTNQLGLLEQIVIMHADAPQEADDVRKALMQSHKDLGDIQTYLIGPTVLAHTGPGAVGIIALARNPIRR